MSPDVISGHDVQGHGVDVKVKSLVFNAKPKGHSAAALHKGHDGHKPRYHEGHKPSP